MRVSLGCFWAVTDVCVCFGRAACRLAGAPGHGPWAEPLSCKCHRRHGCTAPEKRALGSRGRPEL